MTVESASSGSSRVFRELPAPIRAMGEHKRHRRNCRSAPDVPGNVALSFGLREVRKRIAWNARVKFDEVTEDVAGRAINVEAYAVELRAVDLSGDPIETQEEEVLSSATGDEFSVIAGTAPATKRERALNATPDEVSKTLTGLVVGLAEQVNVHVRKDAGGDAPRVRCFIWNVTDSVEVVGKNADPDTVAHPTNVAALSFTPVIGKTYAVRVSWVSGTGIAWLSHANWHIKKDFAVWRKLIPAEEGETGVVHTTFIIDRPKSWRFQTRVKAMNRHHGARCWSAWSGWTTPKQPTIQDTPGPPAPTFGATPITFDRVGKGKRRHTRLKFTFDEVLDWDIPGGDRESDMHHYVVVIDRSDDGTTWDGTPWYRHKIASARQDDDVDTTRTVHFRVARGNYYRAKVRSVDRFNRRGAFSAFTDAALPFDDVQPPRPEDVRIFEGATDRLVVDWTAPTSDYPTRGTVSGTSGTATLTGTGTKFTVEIEAGTRVKVGGNTYTVKKVTSDTALTLTTNLSTSPSGAVLYEVDEHFDIAGYVVQIAKSADVATGPTPDEWNGFHARDVTQGTRKAFKVGAADRGDTFFGRVRSVDMARNKSKWVPATIAGNDDPDVSGDGVTIGAAGASVVATFSKPGLLQAKHYKQRWTNTTGTTLKFKRARAVVGLKDEPAGSHAAGTDGHPTGSSVKINLRRWLADESAHNPIFQVGGGGDDDDRLIIGAGTHKDTAGVTTFEITELEPDEAISVKIAQIGSTLPGEDLVVQVYMEPA